MRDFPTEPKAHLARARTHAGFHRFSDALADIECAEKLSLDTETANGERAAIFQALGRYDESLALREEAAKRRASFEHVAALVGLHAERGEIEAAERQSERELQQVSRCLANSSGASRFPAGTHVDERRPAGQCTHVIQRCAAPCARLRPGGRPSLRSRSGIR